MAKNISPQKSMRADHSLRLTFIIIGSFLLFVASLVFLKLQAQPHTFCANSESCIKNLSGRAESSNKGTFMGRDITAPTLPSKPLITLAGTQNVLGDTTGDYKRIYVDLTNQKLYAYEGNTKVFDFDVSTGKWGRTPTGNFRIWIWLRYTRMSGGNGATYYNLPNVPYTMFFYNDSYPKYQGYGLHGAYWHDNFGHPMSHGCVNMRPEEAGKLFYWTNPTVANVAYANDDNRGTLITIYGVAPNE